MDARTDPRADELLAACHAAYRASEQAERFAIAAEIAAASAQRVAISAGHAAESALRNLGLATDRYQAHVAGKADIET